MAGITDYGSNGWMFGQQMDAFPDQTLSQKKWDAYIAGIDAIEEEIRQQVKSEGEMNLQVADAQRQDRREVWAEEWEKFVSFTKANLERVLKDDGGSKGLFASMKGEEILLERAGRDGMLKVEAGQVEEEGQNRWFPYDCLSQDGATITYNGITFQCDPEEHTISLGDTTSKRDTIVILLSGGGTLLVNKNRINSLGKAIGMFSSEDIGIILRTVAEYKRIAAMEYEMEEEEEREMDRMTQGSSGIEEEEQTETNRIIQGSSGMEQEEQTETNRMIQGSSGTEEEEQTETNRMIQGSSGMEEEGQTETNRMTQRSSESVAEDRQEEEW